jgi:hypothetical protein
MVESMKPRVGHKEVKKLLIQNQLVINNNKI